MSSAITQESPGPHSLSLRPLTDRSLQDQRKSNNFKESTLAKKRFDEYYDFLSLVHVPPTNMEEVGFIDLTFGEIQSMLYPVRQQK